MRKLEGRKQEVEGRQIQGREKRINVRKEKKLSKKFFTGIRQMASEFRMEILIAS